jgi:hypothetical protein
MDILSLSLRLLVGARFSGCASFDENLIYC